MRDLKHLFTNDEVYYEAIFVRSALKNRFEEYEIARKQKSTKNKQKIQVRVSVVFIKVNDPFDRYIEYVDSDSLILRRADDTQVFISNLYDSLLENFEKKKHALRGSNLVFDGIELTLVQFIKLKLKRGGSYIPTPDWI